MRTRNGGTRSCNGPGRGVWNGVPPTTSHTSRGSRARNLVRETYFGRRWIRKHLAGCDAQVAFNPDPPARSLQMQQILAKAGIPYLFISRYHEGLYRWYSPDGSSVLAYSPGHYSNHLPMLNGAPEKGVHAIQAKLAEAGPYYQQRQIAPVYALINSTDFSKPVDFGPLIGLWNDPAAAPGTGRPPALRYASMRGFFEAINRPQARLDTLMGERPDVWVYITGPTHHLTSSVRREAARLLPAAEIFSTMACLLDGSFAPGRRLHLSGPGGMRSRLTMASGATMATSRTRSSSAR